MKLTAAQRRTLEWFDSHEGLLHYGQTGNGFAWGEFYFAPTSSNANRHLVGRVAGMDTINALVKKGLLVYWEKDYPPTQRVDRTPAGRAALEE